MIKNIIEYNKAYVSDEKYKPLETSKYPDKKLAIVTCMDTRLTELLPAALGLKNGDAKIIKNAGGVISHPFGSVMRSLMIAIYEFDVKDIMIIGHTDCGVQHMNSTAIKQKMTERGVSINSIDTMEYCGINFDVWLSGFSSVEDSLKASVKLVKEHPFLPKDINVEGYVMDSQTGELSKVI